MIEAGLRPRIITGAPDLGARMTCNYPGYAVYAVPFRVAPTLLRAGRPSGSKRRLGGYVPYKGIQRDIQNEVENEEEARRVVDDDGKAMDADDLPEGTEVGPDQSDVSAGGAEEQ